MTETVCADTECSFSLTGVCARSYSDPEECPYRNGTGGQLNEKAGGSSAGRMVQSVGDGNVVTTIGEPVLSAPVVDPSLPRSGTLGSRDLDLLMRDRYVNLIGIVGLPDAGKTACIASLYLLLAHGMLDGFTYANSKTLIALDEISRGARRWNNGYPEQMTLHTELADDRQAGFLHLRLLREADSKKIDIVVPDLPGEWSRQLITHADSDRFSFLGSAEVLWVMVNGRDFYQSATRQAAIHDTTNLIERLSELLKNARPRLILVSTWRDISDFPRDAFDRIEAYAKPLGFDVELASIASFSENDAVRPGIGISELIVASLTAGSKRENPWPHSESLPNPSERLYLDFRRQA
ncbi:TRAFAC clade GTPase domain-containing protein [Pararhizobium qamdonense]|uniref:TRAFAC clade GTPase domain-containing protein n=1 Tax=Pararhizobium qamdonense TaxID=3031126 RepID=UPI0023E0D3DE|nr:hypothetical protein [Pararhizobium qamdonense]